MGATGAEEYGMVIVVVCVASALFGGWLGWRKGTSDLYARSFDPMQPALGSSSSVRDEIDKRKRNRLVKTALYALAGPLVALVALMVFARFR
jgi:hypothetical protein